MSTDNKKIHLRFLHCSDIHLDTPFVGLTADKSEERRRVLRSSFMRMMQYVRDSKINVVLMSGDLFNTEYATNTTAEVLIREFVNCPDTVFIISPGKHDHYNDNPIYTSHRLPSNCYVFSSDKLSRFDFEEYNVTVYGWAFMDSELRENPLIDRHVDDASRVNLVCAYADLDGSPDSTCCPVSVADIKRFGADYYALGSRHESSKFATAGASKYAYAGSLECTGFDEPGIGGANLISVAYSDGELSIENKKVSFGHVRFETEKLDITGVNTGNEIISRISRMISDKKYDNETALKVELVGSVDPRFVIPMNIESDAFGLYYFNMIDKTLPTHGTESLKRDMSMKGQIYRSIYPDLFSDDEEKRLISAKALRIALAALEGRELQ
ncbi:MAG: metallophosphoesterase [Clostridia bacterium]|nr:metallophosphoesterase [Clostridia bacterium]